MSPSADLAKVPDLAESLTAGDTGSWLRGLPSLAAGTAAEPDPAAGRVARLGAGGVVARPGLFGRLGGRARVTVVAAPAGSGKTVLLQSWIKETSLADRAAFVAVAQDERDPQRFWLSVVDALSRTVPGRELMERVAAAPDLDGWAIAERLLSDLAQLAEPLWLVVDDVHELGEEALRQLELLVMRAPRELRFVLASRRDVRLGLHRLRLEGELAEIRAGDLKFTLDEAVELFTAAGVDLPGLAAAALHERTEGWAAGLRLAALAATGHPDPARFASEFSGTERTVAEYLLAEVLDRQPDQVRRLLLRTSILARVNGELADLLTGDTGGERVLHDLEEAGAFTVSVDTNRSWFRYHQMFAGLLRLELRRTAPGTVAGLHRSAAAWLAGHEYPVEAIRHMQAAGDWDSAAALLADHWPGLYLTGQDTTVHQLLAGFPPEARAAGGELAVLAAADELARGSLEGAERHLGLAERASGSVADGRRRQFEVLLGVVRLLYAHRRGNPQAVAEQAQRLQAVAEAGGGAELQLGEELRALALIRLGSTEIWTGRYAEAYEHLEQGVALGGRVGRPGLEFIGLAELAKAEIAGPLARSSGIGGPLTRAAERARQAIALAERHGWTDESGFGVACTALGFTLAWQGRHEEAEPWVERAERIVTSEAEPRAAAIVSISRGVLEAARGRDHDALTAFQAAERFAGRLEAPSPVGPLTRALQMLVLLRLGDTERAELSRVAGQAEPGRQRLDARVATAALRLAQGDPGAAVTALAPVLDGSASAFQGMWLSLASLLEATAQDALGDHEAAGRALERALDLAEPDGAVLPFLLHPAPRLLERQARGRTGHAALIAEVLDALAGNRPVAASSAAPRIPVEPLSETELRVLRYLPTNLTAPEIAGQLYVSVNTVKSHVRNLYGKLGTHRRAEAVARARSLGLLAPSSRS